MMRQLIICELFGMCSVDRESDHGRLHVLDSRLIWLESAC